MRKVLFLFLSAILAACLVVFGSGFDEKHVVAQEALTILTSDKSSYYYKAATELTEILKKSGFTLNVKESSGSFQNLQELGKGNADLAFAQADVLTFLHLLSDKKLSQLAENVKIFAPISNEVVHIIVNSSSGINSFADLSGKNVGVGPEKSGTYISALLLEQLNNFDVTREKLSSIGIQEAIKKVITGELDAAFYTVGIGAPLLKNINSENQAKIKLLSIDDDRFIRENKGTFKDVLYISTKIPANTYPWQQQEVNAISTFSFLYAKKSLETQKVYQIAKATYAKASELKASDPFWKIFGTAEAKSQVFVKLDYHPGVKKLLDEQ